MTLLPLEDWNVVGVNGPEYPLGDICVAPGCTQPREYGGGHHVWRRSFLVGDYNYVKLPDGHIVPNLIGLCTHHHKDITENKSRIEYDRDQDWFLYDGVYIKETVVDDTAGHAHDAKPGSLCPTCHRKVPVKTKKEKARPRSVWSVRVPQDSHEDGKEVIESLLEASLEKLQDMGLAYDTDTPKYFLLTSALVGFIQS